MRCLDTNGGEGMSKLTNKQQLQLSTERQWYKMWQLITALPENQQLNFAIASAKKQHLNHEVNVRDVLMHLYEWHQLLLKWVTQQEQGIDASFLPTPYTWKTYDTLNNELWQRNQEISYQEARCLVNNSHEAVLALLMQFNNEELFVKQYYSWTGTLNLASYFILVLSDHYNWACKKLHKQLKLNQKACDNSQ